MEKMMHRAAQYLATVAISLDIDEVSHFLNQAKDKYLS